jgi:hypothetical protein
MTITEMIDGFTDIWPDAEFGPAHIVLSDFNLADGHILWCIALARAALSRNAEDLMRPEMDVPLMEDLDWYSGHSREELAATVRFLTELLAIPEVERDREEA